MSPPPSSGKPLPFHKTFFASAVAACTAEVGPIVMSLSDHELIAAVRDLGSHRSTNSPPGSDTASGHGQSSAPSAGLRGQIQVSSGARSPAPHGWLTLFAMDLFPILMYRS